MTWRYRSLTKTSQALSNSPIYWFISFIAALLGSAYYYFGSVPAQLTTPLLLFSSIAATLTITSYGFHSFFKTSEPGFIKNVIDFTLFGMQRLLSIYIPIITLLIYASTQTSTEFNFYFGNIIGVWVGFGAVYGAITALKKLKIDFD